MATKKQHGQFHKEVEKILIEIGAKKADNYFSNFQYTVHTYAGNLFVSCHEASKSPVFSIYLRFDNYKDASALIGSELGMNPKWNVHEYDQESAIKQLKRKLNRIAFLKERYVLA